MFQLRLRERHFTFAILSAVCFGLSTASAKTPEELLHQASRPTLAEIEETYRGSTERWLYPPSTSTASEIFQVQYDLKEKAARLIAAFEYLFPGGTYASLGRDSVLASDLLDAFYRSIGQNHRVLRLNASGASFTAVGKDPAMMLGFMKSSGFDVERILSGVPFVLFDATNFAPSSQSTALYQAGFKELLRQEPDPKKLVKLFSVIDIKLLNNSIDLMKDFPDRDAIFTKMMADVTEVGVKAIPSMKIPEISYTVAWHDTFGPLEQGEDGKIFAKPGAISAIDARKGILNIQWMIRNLVRERNFIPLVRKYAEAFGYEFNPNGAPGTLKLMDRKPLPERKARMSDIVFQSMGWIENAGSSFIQDTGLRPMKFLLDRITGPWNRLGPKHQSKEAAELLMASLRAAARYWEKHPFSVEEAAEPLSWMSGQSPLQLTFGWNSLPPYEMARVLRFTAFGLSKGNRTSEVMKMFKAECTREKGVERVLLSLLRECQKSYESGQMAYSVLTQIQTQLKEMMNSSTLAEAKFVNLGKQEVLNQSLKKLLRSFQPFENEFRRLKGDSEAIEQLLKKHRSMVEKQITAFVTEVMQEEDEIERGKALPQFLAALLPIAERWDPEHKIGLKILKQVLARPMSEEFHRYVARQVNRSAGFRASLEALLEESRKGNPMMRNLAMALLNSADPCEEALTVEATSPRFSDYRMRQVSRIAKSRHGSR